MTIRRKVITLYQSVTMTHLEIIAL